jgi:hypothetical protein
VAHILVFNALSREMQSGSGRHIGEIASYDSKTGEAEIVLENEQLLVLLVCKIHGCWSIEKMMYRNHSSLSKIVFILLLNCLCELYSLLVLEL